MIEIKSGIPYPSAECGPHGRPRVYPFPEMQTGDCIEVPLSQAKAAKSAVVKWKAQHPGWNYATHRGVNAFGIWRTA